MKNLDCIIVFAIICAVFFGFLGISVAISLWKELRKGESVVVIIIMIVAVGIVCFFIKTSIDKNAQESASIQEIQSTYEINSNR